MNMGVGIERGLTNPTPPLRHYPQRLKEVRYLEVVKLYISFVFNCKEGN